MAVLRPVSRSFDPRLRLRALHLDTLLRTAGSAPIEEGPGAVVSRGVSSHRYRVAPDAGGLSAHLRLAPQVTYITRSGQGDHPAGRICHLHGPAGGRGVAEGRARRPLP